RPSSAGKPALPSARPRSGCPSPSGASTDLRASPWMRRAPAWSTVSPETNPPYHAPVLTTGVRHERRYGRTLRQHHPLVPLGHGGADHLADAEVLRSHLRGRALGGADAGPLARVDRQP